MALTPRRIPVGTTATQIYTRRPTGPLATVQVLVRNPSASSVFLGGPTVTAETGFELPAGESVALTLAAGEAVYGVVTSGEVTIHTLASGPS